MNRYTSLFTLITTALTLTACGGGSSSSSDTPTDSGELTLTLVLDDLQYLAVRDSAGQWQQQALKPEVVLVTDSPDKPLTFLSACLDSDNEYVVDMQTRYISQATTESLICVESPVGQTVTVRSADDTKILGLLMSDADVANWEDSIGKITLNHHEVARSYLATGEAGGQYFVQRRDNIQLGTGDTLTIDFSSPDTLTLTPRELPAGARYSALYYYLTDGSESMSLNVDGGRYLAIPQVLMRDGESMDIPAYSTGNIELFRLEARKVSNNSAGTAPISYMAIGKAGDDYFVQRRNNVNLTTADALAIDFTSEDTLQITPQLAHPDGSDIYLSFDTAEFSVDLSLDDGRYLPVPESLMRDGDSLELPVQTADNTELLDLDVSDGYFSNSRFELEIDYSAVPRSYVAFGKAGDDYVMQRRDNVRFDGSGPLVIDFTAEDTMAVMAQTPDFEIRDYILHYSVKDGLGAALHLDDGRYVNVPEQLIHSGDTIWENLTLADGRRYFLQTTGAPVSRFDNVDALPAIRKADATFSADGLSATFPLKGKAPASMPYSMIFTSYSVDQDSTSFEFSQSIMLPAGHSGDVTVPLVDLAQLPGFPEQIQFHYGSNDLSEWGYAYMSARDMSGYADEALLLQTAEED